MKKSRKIFLNKQKIIYGSKNKNIEKVTRKILQKNIAETCKIMYNNEEK